MQCPDDKKFGGIISRLLAGEHLCRADAYNAFCMVVNDSVTEMQQGAFLAALKAKGETAEEIAGIWEAIYTHDTAKTSGAQDAELVDTCGTGMDSCNTFNISTAASLVAAAGGAKIARHGARAISSSCGTVDIVEAFGVDVDCSVDVVMNSVRHCGIGLFNGMSPAVHPGALGRILSKIHFGSPLNIAASLASPVMPTKGLRGVYAQEMMEPVLAVMRRIGYTDVIIVHGTVTGEVKTMDEASVCGETMCLHLRRGRVEKYAFRPEDVGLRQHDLGAVEAKNGLREAALHMLDILAGRGEEGARDIVAVNAGLIFVVSGQTETLVEGVDLAKKILAEGRALNTLSAWVETQNRNAEKGRARLQSFFHQVM